MKASAVRGAYFALFAGLLAGCASSPTIDVRHDPVYRAEVHTSNIDVMAASEHGIDHIDVVLLYGPLAACERDHLPSLFPCREYGEAQSFTCSFATRAPPPSSNTIARIGALPKSAHCPIAHDLDALTLLTYRATAVDGAGKSVTTRFITFSGGAPASGTVARREGPGGNGPPEPTGVIGNLDLIDTLAPPPRGPYAEDVLRPMWLTADGPPGAWPATQDITLDLRHHLDVAFFPDPDWGDDYRAFSDATGRDIAGRVLFLDAYGYNGRKYVEAYRFWRSNFAYWVGPSGASTPGRVCGLKFTGWPDAMRAVTDGQVIVHQTFFRDCAFLGPHSSGTVSGTAGDVDYIFVHESGHFLYGMGDEYPEDGIDHGSVSNPPNTYPTKEQCEAVATQYSYPTSWCIPIGDSSGWWRVSQDPGPYQDIMDGSRGFPTGYLSTDWYDTNHDVILKQMAKCQQGGC
jgi:hypothetical protein